MPRSKANNNSKKRKGIDFKKIRRKVGRKLPSPKNTTDTEIKSKAIVLPEQSLAAEKAGLAVNKKCLTFKELLQQTSHYNPKVRRDALNGIKDLFTRYPAEQKLHKYAAVEKLRERIGDDDKLVQKSLYDLFKVVILTCYKEDNPELIVSLLMPYIFNAMTHWVVDVRMMAFDFLDLTLKFYPPFHHLMQKSIRTCTASIRYSERCWPRMVMLCSESLVGLESRLTSILKREELLSKEGFCGCGTKYQ